MAAAAGSIGLRLRIHMQRPFKYYSNFAAAAAAAARKKNELQKQLFLICMRIIIPNEIIIYNAWK